MRADFPGVAREIDAQREQLRLAEIEGAAAEAERSRLAETLAAFDAVIRDAADKRGAIESNDALRGAALEQVPTLIETRLRQFTELENAGTTKLGQLESAATLDAKLRESGEVLARFAAERTGAQRAAAELEQRAAQTQSIIAAHQPLLAESGNLPETLRAARDESLVVSNRSGASSRKCVPASPSSSASSGS